MVEQDTTVLLVRHGETDFNRAGRVQGWLPVPLNDRGRRQARETGVQLSAYDVDTVISSDLRRARETAEIIREECQSDTFYTDPRWREQSFGIYEGCDSETFGQAVENISPQERIPEGEALIDVRNRAKTALNSLPRDGDTIVIVSHSVTISQAVGNISGYSPTEAISMIHTDNTEYHELRVNDYRAECVSKVNDLGANPRGIRIDS